MIPCVFPCKVRVFLLSYTYRSKPDNGEDWMRVGIIGGGAAGQLAAIYAARNGNDVTIFEQNEKLGQKLYITGKGRCNLTNACDSETFFTSVVRNPRFLYSAYSFFGPEDIIHLVEKAGVPTKTERGQRVFPVSDKSSDILKALRETVQKEKVRVRLNTKVTGLIIQDSAVTGIRTREGTERFDAIVLATGGLSYPSTGSTGDGYRFAQSAGHTVTALYPSLIALETEEKWCAELAGLSLRNVVLSAYKGKKQVYSELGEMLFTHTGVSGPLVLSCSSIIAKEPEGILLKIDMKPGLSEEQLENRLMRDIASAPRKTVFGALTDLLPKSLLPVVMKKAGIEPDMPASSFSKSQRKALTETLKGLPLHVTGAGPIEEAVITCGGVSTKEINPSTMESKLIRNLYFAGEMIDVDAFTGGFNLQIAWSTGALAGNSIGNINI